MKKKIIMKIAVNTRLLIDNKLDGIGWFTYNTLKILVEKHKEIEFIFIFDRKFDTKFVFASNVKPIVCPPPTRHPILWNIWLNFSLPFFLNSHKIDLFLSPDGFIPKIKKIPILNVIHDINFYHYPNDLPKKTSKFYNKFFPTFAKKSNHLATVSEYSKNDISKNYNINENKITVVYNGCNEIYKPIDLEKITEIKAKYSDNKDYFVFIGSIHPRKNIKRLILAFEKFKFLSNSDVKLIIIGPKFFNNSDLFITYNNLNHKNDIIFTGRLDDNELHNVLAASLCLAFVPYFEGFGIPILEAMNCNIPVISSNVTSMPEVAGDAALYVNPFDINEISNAMEKIYSDKSLRVELIEKGKIQRQKFSWEKSADLLWSAIEKAIK